MSPRSLHRGRTWWSKEATIRDPFGAELVLAQFDPPESFLGG